jgi:hypothetical protein
MANIRNPASLEAAEPAAVRRQVRATHPPENGLAVGGLPLLCRRIAGFTLAELLVSISVLTLLVFLATQLVNSAATVTILGNKRIDADSEARQVLDRMAIDFAQMVKRIDVNYYVKLATQQRLQNDQIAFYSSVPGYNPSSGTQGSVSLLAYRVNSDPNSTSYNKMERLGKGLVWNGASATDTPVVFLPFTISNTWPSAVSMTTADSSYEIIGPDVFRLEYYYLLKTSTGQSALSDSPCLDAQNCATLSIRDVLAIVVDIAVIDPRSKVLLTDQQIATLNGNSGLTNFLTDWSQDYNKPGKLLNAWQNTLNAIIRTQRLPRQAASGVRFYERYFYLSQ